MTREEALDLVAGRLPVAGIAVDWERTGYTGASFDAWARSPGFTGWEGDLPAEDEVRVMTDFLGLKRGDSVLDLACGFGRHAEILAGGYGMKVTGLDIVSGLIEAARKRAAEKRIKVDYRAGQAKDLDAENDFHAVIVTFNSFSLFSPADVPGIVSRIGRALKPGGRLFLDLDNKEYCLRAGYPSESWERWERGWKLQETCFDEDSSVETCRDIYVEGGSKAAEEFLTFKRLYSLSEIGEVLSAGGFTAGPAWGDWRGSPVQGSKPKIILAAAKAADAD